ncbi:MAG: monovalent cation/H+ antiporter complex subunit F [Microlunatus sp.]
MTGAASVIIMIGVVLLGAAMALTLVRMTRGPSTLDRVIAADVVVAIVIAALAMEAAHNHHTTTIPIMLVLSLLGFAGALSMARFAADRDRTGKWRDSTSESAPSSAQPSRRESEAGGEGR